MAESINIAPLLPCVIEVTILDLAKALKAISPSENKFRLPFYDGNESLETDFDYRFGVVGGNLDERIAGLAQHNMRSTAVEFIIANEIHNRIGFFLRDAVTAAVASVFELDSGILSDGGFYYDQKSGELGVNDEYVISLLDLSKPQYGDPSFSSVFDVDEIRLNSPVKIKSAIVGIALQLNIAVAPVPAAIAAAPAVTAASQAVPIITAIGSTIAGAATAGAFGYTIHIRRAKENEIKEKIEKRLNYYISMLSLGNCEPIQNDLQLLGLYNGKIDNDFGKNSEKARRLFAIRSDLHPDISYKEPAFLHALATATIEAGRAK